MQTIDLATKWANTVFEHDSSNYSENEAFEQTDLFLLIHCQSILIHLSITTIYAHFTMHK